MKARIYALLALVSIAASTVIAQSGLAERLDAIAGAGVRGNRSVGLTVAVARGKETLLLKAYGKSDVGGDVPMALDTVIPIGSTTKQFTAAAILQLRDQGKLGLDDEITKWLPDFDTRGNKVTLRHLLGHTSGVSEIAEMPELRALKLIRNPAVTFDDVYKIISHAPFRFPTGTMQMYSNSGFWLLGRIVEKASGMTYEDYIEKRIFEPLGMSRSMYCNNSESVPRRAFGYGMKGGNTIRVPDIVHTGTYAAGAICSTTEDMIAWLRALHGGKVLAPRSYTEMITPLKLNDGTALRYAMGLAVAEDSRGIRYIGHNGGGFGFSSEARWYPDGQVAIVILTNSEPDEITLVTGNLVAELLPAPRPTGPFTGDASQLVGTYKGPGRGGEMVVEVTKTADGIAFSVAGGPAGPLMWVDGLRFRRNESLLTFRRPEQNQATTELRLDTVGDYFILKRQ